MNFLLQREKSLCMKRVNAVSGGFGSKNIRGSPPLLGVQSSNNLDISGTTHTLDTSQSVTSHKKVRTLTNLHPLMNVRPIDTFNGVPQTTQNLGVTSTRFQIGGGGARRMLFDSHSQSHLVNRAKPNLVAQGYPSITSPQNTDLGSLISPSGGPKRRVMSTKFKAEWIKFDSKNAENNNMQVKQFGEQDRNKQDEKGITFSKFSKNSDSKAKFLVKPEHLNAMRVLRPLMKEKKVNKENTAIDTMASVKSMSVLDKFYSPKELHFRVPV